MPKGPKGEKRPADVIGAAVKVMKIATGEIEEDIDGDGKDKAAVELGRKGGEARAKKLTKKRLLQEKKFKLTHYPAPAGLFFIQQIARCRYEDIAPSLWEAYVSLSQPSVIRRVIWRVRFGQLG